MRSVIPAPLQSWVDPWATQIRMGDVRIARGVEPREGKGAKANEKRSVSLESIQKAQAKARSEGILGGRSLTPKGGSPCARPSLTNRFEAGRVLGVWLEGEGTEAVEAVSLPPVATGTRVRSARGHNWARGPQS